MSSSSPLATVSSFDVSPILRALRRSEVFSVLTGTSALAELAEQAKWISVPRRKEIAGEEGGSIFALVSGRVRVCAESAERGLTLGYVDAGEIFGEEALFPGGLGRSFVAIEAVEGVALPVRLVDELLDAHPRFAAAMLRYVGERRANLERRLTALLGSSVESRVVEFILESAARYGVPDSRGTLVSQRFTHLDIANYVGSTRETVTLVLGELKRAGLLALEHRRVVILDREGLVARAAAL